jgi:hypothetical protein
VQSEVPRRPRWLKGVRIVGLPEVLAEIQEDAACRRALATLLGVERYDFVREPMGAVHAVSLTGRAVGGQAWTVRDGETVVVRAEVDYTGVEPHGDFVHTNLEGRDCERLMDRVAEGVYEGAVSAGCGVGAFWLTVSAATRRHDHTVRRRWAGVNASLRVEPVG